MGLFEKLDALDKRFGAQRREQCDEHPPLRTESRLLVAVVALLVVPAMTILLFQTVRSEVEDNRVRTRLARDGVPALGTVIDVRSPNRKSVLPRAARVEFMTEAGATVKTWLPVSHRPEEGMRVELRYSRAAPSVARVIGDETPYRGRWKMVALGGPIVAIALLLLMMMSDRLQRGRREKPSYWTGAGA